MPRVLTGVSTIRTRAGKAADCGARTATARLGLKRAARAQCRAPCISSFGQIRSRIDVCWRINRSPRAYPCGALALFVTGLVISVTDIAALPNRYALPSHFLLLMAQTVILGCPISGAGSRNKFIPKER